MAASLVPFLSADVHLVLCDFGKAGWSRDISEAIAAKVRDIAERDGRELTNGTSAFIDAHIGVSPQRTLPLW
jgi:hypothetical protein